MPNLFERLNAGQQQSEEATKSPNGLHDRANAPESDQTRQEWLEARLDTLAADLRRFQHSRF
jgi:hypothetical protein